MCYSSGDGHDEDGIDREGNKDGEEHRLQDSPRIEEPYAGRNKEDRHDLHEEFSGLLDRGELDDAEEEGEIKEEHAPNASGDGEGQEEVEKLAEEADEENDEKLLDVFHREISRWLLSCEDRRPKITKIYYSTKTLGCQGMSTASHYVCTNPPHGTPPCSHSPGAKPKKSVGAEGRPRGGYASFFAASDSVVIVVLGFLLYLQDLAGLGIQLILVFKFCRFKLHTVDHPSALKVQFDLDPANRVLGQLRML